jgi:hypothetical protein
MLRQYLRPVIALTCLLCGLLEPQSALAFCRETSGVQPADGCECPDDGMPLFWEQTAIPYALNEHGFAGVSDRALRGALTRSFAQWTAVTCDSEPVALALKQLAQTTVETKKYLRSGPNLNVIALLSAQDFLAARGDRHAVALTTTTVIKDTGEIIDADTVFNAGLGPFSVCPDQGCPAGTVDIENVATHEFGHFLGLAHSDDDNATMACTAKTKDELRKRSLESDDEDGICSIYGEPAIEERDEALHPRRIHTGCGCRIHDAHGTGRGAVPGFLTLAALFVLHRRARASSRRRHR